MLSLVWHAAAAADVRPGNGDATLAERVDDKTGVGLHAVSNFVKDALITTQVKAAFVGNGSLKAMHIDVTTTDRIVHLSGAVETPEQRATAERLAGDVANVVEVINRLTIGRQ